MEDSRDILELDETGTIIIGCDKNATEVVIPEGIESIGEEAFCGCKSLESVAIPKSVTKIGRYAFLRSDSLSAKLGTGDIRYANLIFSYDKDSIVANKILSFA